ncbi:selenocysteine insertion sequence-binding protein 2 isoform X2 [Herpailurus yagouaroundi]|uniref:selenocysteine insertion sequence-binding protein 2 isoform X2 n=1 Tax=Herpailurus yagouaroundi TaxID=1608482 RepID=UPI001AD6D8EC|nr:selenocysteine insertion sequence-binding protein 2 isoform X2 [Puma yagouaroundi]
MASEGPREPAGEGIKLSADVKPFVPKFAGLNVVWSESSEARVFPSCAAPYYPCAQELPGPEQKLYAEDVAFGASAFPPQYLSSELAVHPCGYSPYPVESTPRVCPVPGAPYAYGHPGCYRAFQTPKPRSEQKKTYDEQKFDSKKADGSLPSDLKSGRGSHPTYILADANLKSDGYHRRTDRKSRIIEKSASASKPGFEFTRMDFPELQGPENREIAETRKQPRWGPLRSASADLSLLGEVGEPAAGTAEILRTARDAVFRNEAIAFALQQQENAGLPFRVKERREARARPSPWPPAPRPGPPRAPETLSTERPPAPKNVTSMINLKTVASSADPKSASMSPSEVFSADPSCKEKHVHPTKKSKASQGGDPEQNEASRKHKKKKEKSKSKYEVLTIQEPPRIEDAEDFPSLAAASERRDRGASPRLQSRQQPQNNFKNSGKKSQVPVQLDLGGMLAALEKKQHAQSARASSKPVVFSVGAVPVLSRDPASGKKGHFSQVKTPHNPLDSSAPLMKKGKQREVPKAKKPTSLKKIILKERQERKQQRLQENAVSPAPASDAALDGESGGDEALDQAEPSEGTEESAAPTPTGQRKSEEPPRTEPQKEADGLCLVPDGAGCPRIHSRRFRDYCSQMLSKEVDACVTDLLRELVRFQDRMYQKDPVKAKTKRRLVLGLREVLKHLKLRKLKCIIISPNCEKIQSKGGLDDTLHTIIGYACEQNIPFVFALNRKALGRSLNKAVPVSVVGIFSYDGAQDQFHRMVELTMAARQAYKTMLENAHQELAGEPGPPAPGSPPPQGPPAPAAGRDKPRYMEIWREHLEAYSRGALELEDSLEASTSQMMNLNL